jgi:hypothetical protein
MEVGPGSLVRSVVISRDPVSWLPFPARALNERGRGLGDDHPLGGDWRAGNRGDDGPATDAQLNEPVALAVTVDGGFLIADAADHVVRKVSSSGTITRVAGTGSSATSGDDGPAT